MIWRIMRYFAASWRTSWNSYLLVGSSMWGPQLSHRDALLLGRKCNELQKGRIRSVNEVGSNAVHSVICVDFVLVADDKGATKLATAYSFFIGLVAGGLFPHCRSGAALLDRTAHLLWASQRRQSSPLSLSN